jgi:hypothetical protein
VFAAARAAAVIAGFLLVTQAFAHHSGAMFDDQKVLTLTGTVHAFQWSNPHCWIQVLVTGPAGPVEWSVEMGSPSVLMRGGWKPRTLRVGDPIVVSVHPMRDGSNGGLYVTATRADGGAIVAPASNGAPASSGIPASTGGAAPGRTPAPRGSTASGSHS